MMKNSIPAWLILSKLHFMKEMVNVISRSLTTHYFQHSKSTQHFSNKYEADGIKFEEPSVNLFSFNNPFGACSTCEGFGSIIGIDEDLVIPDKSLSVFDGAVVAWHGEKMSEWKDYFVMNSYKLGFPVHKPYYELTEKQKNLLWKGKVEKLYGLNQFFHILKKRIIKFKTG